MNESLTAPDDERPIAAPTFDIDWYSDEVQGDIYPHAARMRDAAPIVWLSKYGVYYAPTYNAVRKCLGSWQQFSSAGGIGLVDSRTAPGPVRKGVVVGSDPPEHSRHRNVLVRILSPSATRKLSADYAIAAEQYIDAALEKGSVDLVSDVIRPFTVTVLGDAVGIPKEGREHLLILGEMILASVGPMNERFASAAAHVQKAGSVQWSERMSRRESLTRTGFGADIYSAVDAGEIDEREAALLVSLFLFGGVDTTITSLANGMKNFIDHPQQWALLSADPTLAKDAFEEVLRFNLPVQQMYRHVAQQTVIEGVELEAGSRIGLGVAAANRDPSKFSDPDRFGIRRKPLGHLGFGSGIHACVGQIIARMEAQALFTALAKRVAEMTLAGEPSRWISGGLASWKSLPVYLQGMRR